MDRLQKRILAKEYESEHGPDVNDAAFETIKTNIQEAYEQYSPELAIDRIGRIWEKLDNIVQFAEAKTRLLLGKLKRPVVPEPPEWLSDRLRPLGKNDEDGCALPEATIESTKLLIGYILAEPRNTHLRATLEKGPLGRAVVDWENDIGRLQWFVAPSELPWPGVNVHVWERKGRGAAAHREMRTFHHALAVRNHLLTFYDS
ncbi:hypothetical protein LZC95_48905 [Pendulispora brunnea]|uniref:Uncharacterized protein n=1 Tax=Pendulispora brunnea TaxID=2905690 RepID=A0ABZ2K8D5_9BACT